MNCNQKIIPRSFVTITQILINIEFDTADPPGHFRLNSKVKKEVIMYKEARGELSLRFKLLVLERTAQLKFAY